MINISENTLFWLFPIIFMIHRFEDLIIMPEYSKNRFDDFIFKTTGDKMKRIRSLSLVPKSLYITVAAIEFIFISVITLISTETGKFNFFTVINILLFIHVYIHISMSVGLKKLTPGFITAVVLIIPYELKLLWYMLRNMDLQGKTILLYLCVILIIYPPVYNILYIWKYGKSK